MLKYKRNTTTMEQRDTLHLYFAPIVINSPPSSIDERNKSHFSSSFFSAAAAVTLCIIILPPQSPHFCGGEKRGREMFAEAALLYPYFQSCSQEVQQLEALCHPPKPNSSLITIAEYDLGGEGDLFKAAEPIIEEPIMSLDPIAAAISMLSCGDGIMPAEGLKVGDMESLQNEQLFSEVFCECNKDIFKKTSAEAAVSEVLDIKLPEVLLNEIQDEKNRLLPEFLFTDSVGSGCLGSMELLNATSMRPSFLSFPELDFSSAYRMRRAFSDGDIKTLGNGNISLIHSPLRPPLVTGGCMSEDRMHKLSRYRDKKSRRNFGRKIKYACRKALADSQPRIRGRFAKTDESDICRKQ